MSTAFEKPEKGEQASAYVGDIAKWNQIVDMLNYYNSAKQSGETAGDQSAVSPIVENTNTSNIEIGTVVGLGEVVEPPAELTDEDILKELLRKPVFEVSDDATWPDLLSNVAISHKAIPEGDRGSVRVARYITASVTHVTDGDQWAMPDPTDPTKLLTSDAGIYRIIAEFPDDDLAVLDTQEEQPIWKFETTGAYADNDDGISVADAKLLRLDGEVFADTGNEVQVYDYFETEATEGMCFHSAGKFIPSKVDSNRIFKTGEDGIPARTDGICPTLGKAEDVKWWDIEGETMCEKDEFAVYNPFQTDIEGDTYIIACKIKDKWVVHAEDCPDA